MPRRPPSRNRLGRQSNIGMSGGITAVRRGPTLSQGIWIIQSATRAFVVNMNQSIIVVLYVLRSVWRFFSRTERHIGKEGELGRKGCLEEQHRLFYPRHAGFDVWVRLYERRYA